MTQADSAEGDEVW